MPLNDSLSLLCRRWIHSHEEDTSTETIFRPAGFPFPPSRGRKAIELRADGTYSLGTPDPVDRALQHSGTWQLNPSDSIVFQAPDGDTPQPWDIRGIDQERLVVSKRTC